MKRKDSYIVRIAVVLVSLVISFAASGVWNASFCCERCAEQGITLFVSGHCSEKEKPVCCPESRSSETASACDREGNCRFEWQRAPVDFYSPVIADFHFLSFVCAVLFPADFMVTAAVTAYSSVPVSGPPPLSGRQLLQRHSVFLI